MQDRWVEVAQVGAFPADGGACARVGDRQIAIFNVGRGREWYACENRCPHRGDMVLARGITGDQNGEPKVACPQHKKAFSLRTGRCLSGETYRVQTFPVKVVDGAVFVRVAESATTADCGG